MPETACRSKGSYTHPCAIFVRFTEEEHRAIRRLTKKRKLTIQTFAHAAIIRALNDANLGKATEHERGSESSSGGPDRAQVGRPRGLGIREKLEEQEREVRERRQEEEEEERSTPVALPSPPPVAIASSSSGDIHMLARTIVELPQASRRDALQAAVRSIAHGRSKEEAIQLADNLDKEILRLDGRPMTALEKIRARRKSGR